MTAEKVREAEKTPEATLFLPKECCVVYAKRFPLKNTDSVDSQLAKGADKSETITPCDSHEERLTRMILELLHLSQSDKKTPLTITTDDESEDLRKAAEILFKDSVFQEILPRITIIQLNALSHTDFKDITTGIRVVTLPPNPVKFSTHPTPVS